MKVATPAEFVYVLKFSHSGFIVPPVVVLLDADKTTYAPSTKSFEEFEVYQKGIELAKLVFKLLENKSFDKEFGFKDQIKRAAISITNNIAEGSEYNNNKQFIRYLKFSKGSAAEVRSMLVLAKELKLLSKLEIEKSYELCIEISQNLSNFIKYLNTKLN